jgi:hypothetical protein
MFFISVVSKGLSNPVSSCPATLTLTGDFISIDSKYLKMIVGSGEKNGKRRLGRGEPFEAQGK